MSNLNIPRNYVLFEVFRAFLYTFVGANLVAFGIPATEYAILAPVDTAWNTAWAGYKNKGTRTHADVVAIKAAHLNYIVALRQFIPRWLTLNTKVSDADLAKMGLSRSAKPRTKSGKPADIPTLSIENTRTPHLLFFFVRRQPASDGSKKRGRAADAAGMDIAIFYGTTPPPNPDDYGMILYTTKSPLKKTFDPSEAGKVIWVAARWVGKLGDKGDWCSPTVTNIP